MTKKTFDSKEANEQLYEQHNESSFSICLHRHWGFVPKNDWANLGRISILVAHHKRQPSKSNVIPLAVIKLAPVWLNVDGLLKSILSIHCNNSILTTLSHQHSWCHQMLFFGAEWKLGKNINGKLSPLYNGAKHGGSRVLIGGHRLSSGVLNLESNWQLEFIPNW